MASRREEVSKLPKDLRELVNLVARSAAVELMNGLAEAGPEWSGEFQDSWVAIPIGKGASGATGGGYPYTLDDVPRLSTSIKETARAKKFACFLPKFDRYHCKTSKTNYVGRFSIRACMIELTVKIFKIRDFFTNLFDFFKKMNYQTER